MEIESESIREGIGCAMCAVGGCLSILFYLLLCGVACLLCLNMLACIFR